MPSTSTSITAPRTSTLYKLIDSGLIQPLNKSYLTNIGNVVAALRDPYYDKGGVYTVPYTVFGTGIGYRADRVDPAQRHVGHVVEPGSTRA